MLLNGFGKLLNKGGNQISVSYYLPTYDSVYDEAGIGSLVKSGNTVWTSGLVFPVNPQSDDNILLEQGKIALSDNKLYVSGGLMLSQTTGSVLITKIGVGSPITDYFSLIMPGTDLYSNEGIPVYKTVYIRVLTNGSLIGV